MLVCCALQPFVHLLDDYEDDLLAADCLPAIMAVMKDNMKDEKLQIAALRFLSNLATNRPSSFLHSFLTETAEVQPELADPNLELIELIVDLMESKALCSSPEYQTEAHLFCTNLSYRNRTRI